MWEDGIAATVALRRAEALAFSIRQTIETVAANILNRAFNPAFTYGDGVELCSDVHPNVTGGTWSNELATPADLSEASLEQAVIDISDFRSDKGLQIAVRPKKMIIPVELVFEAERILKSDLRVATPGALTNVYNDINAIKSSGAIPEGYCVNHYLEDEDAYAKSLFPMINLRLYAERHIDKPLNCGKIQNGQSAAKPAQKAGRFNDYPEMEYMQAHGSGGHPGSLGDDIVWSSWEHEAALQCAGDK